MIEYARLITKSSEGPPTIPPSASHDNGDWSSNDIYEHELYMDSLTGYTYTRQGDAIILLSTGEGLSKWIEIDVLNKGADPLPKMAVCYFKTSSSSADTPEVLLADNSSEATSSKTMGILKDEILPGETGKLILVGEYDAFDTSAYNVGDRLWLGTLGGIITTPPTAPRHAVFIGIVSRSHHTQGRICVSIQNGYELEELHNVSITTPTDGQALIYEAASGLWKNITIPQGITIGTTPIMSGTDGRILFQNGGVVSQSANLFWDNPNGRLGLGTSTPVSTLTVNGLVTALQSNYNSTHSGNTARGFYIVNSADSVVRAGIEYDGTNAFVQLAGRYNNGSPFFRQNGANGDISFLRSGVEFGRIFGATGNWAVNATTDVGFKLDVNGTARVLNSKFSNNGMQIQTTSSNPGGISLNGSAEISNQLTVSSGFTIRQSNSVNATSGAAINLSSATVISTSGEIAIASVSAQFGFTTGTATGNALSLTPFINTSGTYSGIVRGFYYAPTFGTTVGITAHYAFHSKIGRIRFEGLPTSPVGLASGEVWNNLGILTIV